MAVEYYRELTVPWGESDPFGLVYFPRMLAWFNDTEHDWLRSIGFGADETIKRYRTAFVMGKINFEFIGPAAYGDRISTSITLEKISRSTLSWRCKAFHAETKKPVTEGLAVRIYAHIKEDGNLEAMPIPEELREIIAADALVENSAAGRP